jgi:hypothetical protein
MTYNTGSEEGRLSRISAFKREEPGQNRVAGSFIICALRQMLLQCPTKEVFCVVTSLVRSQHDVSGKHIAFILRVEV